MKEAGALFAEQVQSARERMAALQRRAERVTDPNLARALLLEGLEELSLAFEELSTAQEELRAQNESLAAAEVAATAERNRYWDLFEFAPNGYLITDFHGVIQEGNRAARELLTGGRRSLVGKPLSIFVCPGEECHRFLVRITALQRGESIWKQTVRFKPLPGGSAPRTVVTSVTPFRDLESRTPLLRWQLQEVTPEANAIVTQEVRRLSAEVDARVEEWTAQLQTFLHETKATERRLAFLSESSTLFATSLNFEATLRHVAGRAVPALGDGCLVDLLDGDGRLRRHLLPPPTEGAPGRHHTLNGNSPPSPGDPSGLPGRTRVVRDTSDLPDELSRAEKDEVRTFVALGWRSVLWLPLTANGEAFGALAIGSARLNAWANPDLPMAEAFARQVAATLHNIDLYRRLGEADRRKDEFLAVLAHELRNPLAPIRNAVQILELRGPADPDLERARKVIDRQVGRLSRLVDDLLDLSRIAQGKVQLRLMRVDLVAAVEAAAEAALPQASVRGLGLTTRLPESQAMVMADPGRMDQILANLLDNAVKYTEPGGQILVELSQEEAQLAIRVRDTGVGVPPEVLPKIFDLFAQEDRSRGNSQGGLGIGLALVKRLVELHGGSIEAKSEGAGKGCEFTIRLSAASSPVTSPPPEPVGELQESARLTRRVLVVEDDVDTATSLADVLEGWGHTVHVAYDGPSALAAAWADPPDVALIDFNLPGMNGQEVASRLRGQPEVRGTVLVAVTGWAGEEQRAYEVGCHHYLTKPVRMDFLQNLLARLTRPPRLRERTLSAPARVPSPPPGPTAPGESPAAAGHETRNALQRTLVCLRMLRLEVGDRPGGLDLLNRAEQALNDLGRILERIICSTARVRF